MWFAQIESERKCPAEDDPPGTFLFRDKHGIFRQKTGKFLKFIFRFGFNDLGGFWPT